VNILGVGTIFQGGVGMRSFEKALEQGWTKPSDMDAKWAAGGKHPVYQVNIDAAPDRAVLKKIRRADRLSKMAVLAAAEAVKDSAVADLQHKSVGIILATAFGAHVTTFGFLDTILDFGEAAVSPTIFSNSVHNAAASYISTALDIKGPTLTVTQFRFSFAAALQLAATWLELSRCDYVLAGAVDQLGDVLEYVASRKLAVAADGKIRPFSFQPTAHVPGEGAAFVLLGNEQTGHAYCTVPSIAVNDDAEQATTPDVIIIDADGMQPDESIYASQVSPASIVTAYSPLFGSMMTGGMFNTAAAALMLKRQQYYAAPVADNPRGLKIMDRSGPASIQAIDCLCCDCSGTKAAIRLAALR